MTRRERWIVLAAVGAGLAAVLLLVLPRGGEAPAPTPPADVAPAVEPGVPPTPPPAEPLPAEPPVAEPAPPPDPIPLCRVTGRVLRNGVPVVSAPPLTVEMTRTGWKKAEADHAFPVAADGRFGGEVPREAYEVTIRSGAAVLGVFDWEVLTPEVSRTFDLADLVIVTCRVLDASDAPVRGATLSFGSIDGAHRRVSVVTDGAGGAEASLVRAARYGVSMESAKRGRRGVGTLVAVEGAVVVFRLAGGSSLSGRVTTEEGRPAAGARLEIDTAAGGGGRFDTTTDETGAFRFPEIPAGHYRVGIRRKSYGLMFLAEGVAVPEGGDAYLELTERPPARGSVAGRVVRPDGTPVAGVRVMAAGDFAGPVYGRTDARGRFRIRGLYGSPVRVWVRDEKSAFNDNVTVRLDSDRAVLVQREACTLAITFRLDGRELTGSVTGSIQAKDEEGMGHYAAFRDEPVAGFRTWRRLPAGRFRLRVHLMRPRAACDGIEVVLGEGSVAEVTVDLERREVVRFSFPRPFAGDLTLLDSDGETVYAASVPDPTTDGSTGRALPLGRYRAVGWSTDGEAIRGDLVLTATDTEINDWTSYRCGVGVGLFDRAGGPAADRSVTIRATDDAFTRTARTDEGGRCWFSPLLPGRYAVSSGGASDEVTVPDAATFWTEVVLTAE